jgi:hypothetical protein
MFPRSRARPICAQVHGCNRQAEIVDGSPATLRALAANQSSDNALDCVSPVERFCSSDVTYHHR